MPLPTHFWGLTINDLGLTLTSAAPTTARPRACRTCRSASTTGPAGSSTPSHTDFNGFYEALEPSTATYNCPVPAGPCPNMYRFIGNDPGQPGHPNADYNPRYGNSIRHVQRSARQRHEPDLDLVCVRRHEVDTAIAGTET